MTSYRKIKKHADFAEIERKEKAHKEHLRKQKAEADYNNQVNGHHTNEERNVLNKLLDRGTDFRPRFPIALKYENKDFEALKRKIEKGA